MKINQKERKILAVAHSKGLRITDKILLQYRSPNYRRQIIMNLCDLGLLMATESGTFIITHLGKEVIGIETDEKLTKYETN